MSEARVVRPRGIRGLHFRLYDWMLHWSAHRHAQTALFLLAAAEASVFPIPPDVLLISMALARPLRAMRYAAIATAGSVSGGLVGFAIGWGLWRLVEGWAFGHLGFLGFTPDNFAAVQTAYQNNAFLAVFSAGFTPIPYKVFTIAAGVFGIGLPVFIAASILGRAGRFFLVAALLRVVGPAVKPFIERYLGWLTLAFVALLIIGFVVIGRFGGHG
jgi:membrane protein YqaA with SNARE-associated domain